MAVRTLRQRTSFPVLRREIIYTVSQLKARPETAPFAPVFEELRGEWDTTFAKSLVISDALAETQARIDMLDAGLDHLAGCLHKTVLMIVQDDRTSALFLRYFKDITLGDLKRPVLGPELDTMASFIPSLKASEHAALKTLGAEIEAVVIDAKDAVITKTTLEGQKRDFYALGEKKKFIDKLNGTRKHIHGELGKLAHEKSLPAGFADQFFLRREATSDEDGDGDEPTIESVEAEIAEIEQTLAARRGLLEKLAAEKAKLDEEEAKLAAEKNTLAELEKAAAEAAQKVALQKAKIAQGTP